MCDFSKCVSQHFTGVGSSGCVFHWQDSLLSSLIQLGWRGNSKKCSIKHSTGPKWNIVSLMVKEKFAPVVPDAELHSCQICSVSCCD